MSNVLVTRGLKELIQSLEGIGKAFSRDALETVMYDAVRPIYEATRSNAPVDTGKLRSAVKISKGKGRRASAYTAVDRKIAPHAWLVEYGTSKMAAQPYLRPALDSNKNSSRKIVRDGCKRLLKGGAARAFSGVPAVGGEFA